MSVSQSEGRSASLAVGAAASVEASAGGGERRRTAPAAGCGERRNGVYHALNQATSEGIAQQRHSAALLGTGPCPSDHGTDALLRHSTHDGDWRPSNTLSRTQNSPSTNLLFAAPFMVIDGNQPRVAPPPPPPSAAHRCVAPAHAPGQARQAGAPCRGSPQLAPRDPRVRAEASSTPA